MSTISSGICSCNALVKCCAFGNNSTLETEMEEMVLITDITTILSGLNLLLVIKGYSTYLKYVQLVGWSLMFVGGLLLMCNIPLFGLALLFNKVGVGVITGMFAHGVWWSVKNRMLPKA